MFYIKLPPNTVVDLCRNYSWEVRNARFTVNSEWLFMCLCAALWWKRSCLTSLKRHGRWEQADRGCVIADAKSLCPRAIEKIKWWKNLQEVTKTRRLRTTEKQSFWKPGDYFRKKKIRMVCFPFLVCFWTLFQTRLCESFVWLKQIVVLLRLRHLENQFSLFTVLSWVMIRGKLMWGSWRLINWCDKWPLVH